MTLDPFPEGLELRELVEIHLGDHFYEVLPHIVENKVGEGQLKTRTES